MSLAISPILRIGPGGDFTLDVVGDRFVAEPSVARGESGSFDPHSGGGGGSGAAGDGGASGEHSRMPGRGWGRDRSGDLVDVGVLLFGSSDERGVAVGADGRDGCQLSEIARLAGGLVVAQRLLVAHEAAVGGVLSIAKSMIGALRRASEPVRAVRHGPDRGMESGSGRLVNRSGGAVPEDLGGGRGAAGVMLAGRSAQVAPSDGSARLGATWEPPAEASAAGRRSGSGPVLFE